MLADYLRCPKYFKYKYLDRLKSPPSAKINLGRAFHYFVSNAVVKGLSGEILFDDPHIRDLAEESLLKIAKHSLSEEEKENFLRRCFNAVSFITELLSSNCALVDIKTEHTMSANRIHSVPNRKGTCLNGRVDLLLLYPRCAFIVDFKFGKLSTLFSDLEKLQMNIYALLAFECIKDIRDIYCVLFYAQSGEILKISFSHLRRERVAKRVARLIERIETDKEFHAAPMKESYCRWCAFTDICNRSKEVGYGKKVQA